MCPPDKNLIVLNFNSKYRRRGTNESPLFKLERPLYGELYRIKNINVPYTFFAMSSDLQNVQFAFREQATNNYFSFNIPNGTYTPSSMASTLQTMINDSGTPDTYSVTYDKTNMGFTILNTNSNNFKIYASNFLTALGFGSSSYSYDVGFSSNRPATLSMPHQLGVLCPQLIGGGINNISLPKSGVSGYTLLEDDLIKPFNVNVDFGKWIVYDGSDDAFIPLYNGKAGISEFLFKLVDLEDNELLDLRGVPWNITIEVRT